MDFVNIVMVLIEHNIYLDNHCLDFWEHVDKDNSYSFHHVSIDEVDHVDHDVGIDKDCMYPYLCSKVLLLRMVNYYFEGIMLNNFNSMKDYPLINVYLLVVLVDKVPNKVRN